MPCVSPLSYSLGKLNGIIKESFQKIARNELKYSIVLYLYLRVLLVKWPDMSKPTFFGQYLFVCIIKSTHQVDVPGNKTWDLRAKTVQWQAILDLGPRQK